MKDLYQNIKERRKAIKMTQSQLAEAVGYADKGMISRIESGAVNLPHDRIEAIARALGTTSSELQGFVKPKSYPYYVEMLAYSLGYRLRGEDDGNLWIEYGENTFDITEEDWELYVTEVAHFAKYNLDRMIMQ